MSSIKPSTASTATSPTYGRDQVVGIIDSVLGKIKSLSEISRENLAVELTELKGIIENLRSQLHATQSSDISSTHIPSAADELDAVVGTTEQATGTIMESCEKILERMKGAQPPELYQDIENYVVKIFEACTFQDITGQRIKKVTTALKQIDQKVSSVLMTLHGQLGDMSGPSGKSATVQADPLLNGPALPSEAVTQDDIDKLLAEFDSGKK